MQQKKKSPIDINKILQNRSPEDLKRVSSEMERVIKLGIFEQPNSGHICRQSGKPKRNFLSLKPLYREHVRVFILSLFFLAPSMRIRIP